MAATVDDIRRMLEASSPGFLPRYNAPEAHGFYAIHAPPIDFADVCGERGRERREREKGEGDR